MRNDNGFTLLELLVAVAILAAVIGPYFTQFVTSTRIGERSERIVRAEFMAQRILEEEKRNTLIPDVGTKRIIKEDGFEVIISYRDETSAVNDSSKKLILYNTNIDTRYIITPEINDSTLNLKFEINGGAELVPINNLTFGSKLKLELVNGSIDNQYLLNYTVGDELPITLDTFSLMKEDVASFRFNAKSNGSDTNLLNFIVSNKTTKADGERLMRVYEFDDASRNFNFSTDYTSTSDVELFLKLHSSEASNSSNDLDYYWIQIKVKDSNGDILTELFSAIRRE